MKPACHWTCRKSIKTFCVKKCLVKISQDEAKATKMPPGGNLVRKGAVFPAVISTHSPTKLRREGLSYSKYCFILAKSSGLEMAQPGLLLVENCNRRLFTTTNLADA